MQIKLLPAILLFLGSYLPLALILAVQDVPDVVWSRSICRTPTLWVECDIPLPVHAKLAFSSILVCSVSLGFFLWLLQHLHGATEMRIEECKTIPNDLINYVFPYIVSFMGVDLGATGKLIGLGLFMAWLFVISYRSGQILMNPLLLAVGWQLYEVKADIEGNKRSLRAISRELIVPSQVLSSCLVQGIYVLSRMKSK